MTTTSGSVGVGEVTAHMKGLDRISIDDNESFVAP
jgi:hypothetical protein